MGAFVHYYPGSDWRAMELGEFLVLLDAMNRHYRELAEAQERALGKKR